MMDVEYSATATGTVLRLVRCDECDVEYVYVLERTGSDASTSHLFLSESEAEKRAKRGAKKKLHEQLKHACDAVPCPECAHVQDHMLGQARFEKARLWFVASGGTLIIAVLLLVFLWWQGVRMGGLLSFLLFGLVAAGLGVVALVFFTTHDPN